VAGATGELHVRFYDAAGKAMADEVYGIAPFGHVQTRVNPSGEAIRSEVTVIGDGRVLAYGSVIDNHSGDAVFIPAGRYGQGFVPAIHAPGFNGTLWRTDVWLSNTAAAPENISVEGQSITVPARGAVVLRDVLGREGRTALFVQVPSSNVLVTSRTYTVGPRGTFGQFVRPELVGYYFGQGPAHLVGVENSTAFRTNLGLVNTSNYPTTVRLIAYDAGGREVWRADVAAERLTQIPLPVPLIDGRVTAEVIGGAGAVIPYASVIDNVTGDPIYINAQN